MIDFKKLAEHFHDSYEKLASGFGYETRKETRVFDPNSANGQLMIAVCYDVLGPILIASKMKDARIDWTVADNVKKALEIARLEKEVKRLWTLLDDISTAGDMFKPEINGYFTYVNRKCEDRHGLVTTDGYTLSVTTVDGTKKVSGYGNCPKCGAKGVSRERRPNGNDRCERGCVYPSRDAVT